MITKSKSKRPPTLNDLLSSILVNSAKPVAFVLTGHNGSGKSTLWYLRMADQLEMPLINADRLTLSILPQPPLPDWAIRLRDKDERWQKVTQSGVNVFRQLVMDQGISFAYETVFSYWQAKVGGGFSPKAEDIQHMQKAGYVVIVLFVGLSNVELSLLRVKTRRSLGGHDVPKQKLIERFPRTQAAIGYASTVADMTLMFDNSRNQHKAFAMVRAQTPKEVLFDARDPHFDVSKELRDLSSIWLNQVTGPSPQTSH